MSLLKRKIAVVTGIGHSKDIGSAICLKLAKDGADVFFTYYEDKDNWPTIIKRIIEETGVRCESMKIDLSIPDAPTKLFDTVMDTMGLPGILVNNAAHSTRDGYAELNQKTLDDHYTVNVRGTCLLSVEFARRFKKSGQTSGRIINMTSGQSLGPMPGELAYAASKGAIEAFTRSLSAEVAQVGITVNAVNPGPTDTGWMTEDLKRELKPKFLMGRAGLPGDAARLVAFLAKEEAGWITGQIINSEGGFLRS